MSSSEHSCGVKATQCYLFLSLTSNSITMLLYSRSCYSCVCEGNLQQRIPAQPEERQQVAVQAKRDSQKTVYKQVWSKHSTHTTVQ